MHVLFCNVRHREVPSPLDVSNSSFIIIVSELSLTVFSPGWGSLTPPLTRTRSSLPHLSLPSHLISIINIFTTLENKVVAKYSSGNRCFMHHVTNLKRLVLRL